MTNVVHGGLTGEVLNTTSMGGTVIDNPSIAIRIYDGTIGTIHVLPVVHLPELSGPAEEFPAAYYSCPGVYQRIEAFRRSRTRFWTRAPVFMGEVRP